MRRPSPAMVVAVVALVSGAGGTATAGVLITSAEIRDNTIRGVDIHDRTITSADVRNRALTGTDVARDSLTGADVMESSLGRVPDANRLDGFDASQFVRKAESFTRHFSCAGTAFENGFSHDDYTLDGSRRYAEDASRAPLFRCSVNLPDGARVTAVSFSVRDDADWDVDCSMWRTNMVSDIGDETAMTDRVRTSGAPGDVRITDTTIDQPVIDNGRFSYFLQCWVGDQTTGLYGANVAYTVTGGQGVGRQVVEPAVGDRGLSSTDRGS